MELKVLVVIHDVGGHRPKKRGRGKRKRLLKRLFIERGKWRREE